MKLTSMSINLPVISGIMKKNCEHDTFVGPSFVIAAMQLSASMMSVISFALPGPKEIPLPDLGNKDQISNLRLLGNP